MVARKYVRPGTYAYPAQSHTHEQSLSVCQSFLLDFGRGVVRECTGTIGVFARPHGPTLGGRTLRNERVVNTKRRVFGPGGQSTI